MKSKVGERKMSKEEVGVAVAGLGFVGGQAHAPAFRKIPGAKLIAVVDVIEELAKKVAAKFEVKYYLDHNEALKDPEIDAIVVAVPTPFHYRLASDAIASGKHVLCEMPLTPTIAESEKLGEAAEKAGVILLPDLNFRFTPNYAKAKELLDQGAVGKPIAFTYMESIAAKDLAAQWPLSSWAWNVDKSGGFPDFTLSVWSLDLIRWLFKTEIDDVNWTANYAPLEGISNFKGYQTMGTVKLSDGTVGYFHFNATVPRGHGTARLEVFGNNTKILRAKWNNYLALIGEETEKQEWEFKEKGTRVWGHRQIDSYFVECILEGKKPSITVEDAIKAQSIAKKIVKK